MNENIQQYSIVSIKILKKNVPGCILWFSTWKFRIRSVAQLSLGIDAMNIRVLAKTITTRAQLAERHDVRQRRDIAVL